jgi:hypothetical protein
MPAQPETTMKHGPRAARQHRLRHGRLWRYVLVISALSLALPLAAPRGADTQETWRTDFSRITVPAHEIVEGGPPKDGIPAIDSPRFETVSEARRWIHDREPVAVVTFDGVTHVYPHQILIWHEIVNDEVGGQPVSVTYCPLCNTTLAFDRRFEGVRLDFGTTGRLRHSDLIMYDRQTETWWQQATGEGIVGRHAGKRLTFLPAPVMSWKDARAEFPEARVLSRDTGHRRAYGKNPYVGYDTRSGPFSWTFFGDEDERLGAMERVVAIHEAGESLAVAFVYLRERGVANVSVGGRRIGVFWSPGTASALDSDVIAAGRDVGTSATFDRVVDGRTLTFEPEDEGRFRDRETGSVWSLSGRATEGPLEGTQLDAVPHGNHFWFAWVAFRPDTRLVS